MGDFTNKMSLVTWDNIEDAYDFEQLAGNWQKLDFHDHSPGRGVPIASGGLALGSVTSNAIASGAVTASKVGYPLYTPMTVSGSAVSGASILANAGISVGLPAASSAGLAPITIVANTGVTGASPVTVTGANIFGIGLSAASSFVLGTPLSSVTLLPQGSNWVMIAGQQDTGWLTITLAGNVGPAASYDTPSARLVGDMVRLKGAFTNTSGSAITIGTTVATVPSAMHPATQRGIGITFPGGLLSGPAIAITTGGIIEPAATNVSNSGTIGLDSMTYAL